VELTAACAQLQRGFVDQTPWRDEPFDLSVSVNFRGLQESANYLGRASFLQNEEQALAQLTSEATSGLIDRLFYKEEVVARARACLRMLKSLWGALEAMARQPILVDTGQYTPRRQQRTFADQVGQIQNELTNLETFHAKVKLLSEEHVIKTFPAPQGVTGDLLAARLTRIKRQMRFLRYVRDAREVDEEIRKRHERLRGSRSSDDPPPTHF
jgi:hypothetical protein